MKKVHLSYEFSFMSQILNDKKVAGPSNKHRVLNLQVPDFSLLSVGEISSILIPYQ